MTSLSAGQPARLDALHRLSNSLVSIDGGDKTTNGYRGRDVWRQVLKNVEHVRDRLGASFTARIPIWAM